MTARALILAVAAVATFGCNKTEPTEAAKPTAKAGTEAPAAEKAAPAPAKQAVPAETAPVALDEGKGEIPATIDAPKGSTTFYDTPTAVRVEYEKGELFGVQVKKGNEFNMDLKGFAEELKQNKYGNTNTVLELTDTLLTWTSQREGSDKANHKFRLLTKLGETTWVCTDGNYGGWDKAAMDQQIAACKTLKAK
ncbi:MAG: hypothetical protein H6702_23895 [Myxococcales bacterium]|nr:hypothetical protein [Myxococcales bacterium]